MLWIYVLAVHKLLATREGHVMMMPNADQIVHKSGKLTAPDSCVKVRRHTVRWRVLVAARPLDGPLIISHRHTPVRRTP